MDKANAIKQRAQTFIKRGQYEKAMAEYARLANSPEVDPGLCILIGDLHLKMDQRSEALERYSQSAERYDQLGLTRNAVAVLKKMLRIEPQSQDIRLRLADLYQRKGHLAEAMTHHLDRAKFAVEGGDRDSARKILEQIRHLATPSARLALRTAELYQSLGDGRGAVAELERCARNLEEQGRVQQARQLIERARSIDAAALTDTIRKRQEGVLPGYSNPDEDAAGEQRSQGWEQLTDELARAAKGGDPPNARLEVGPFNEAAPNSTAGSEEAAPRSVMPGLRRSGHLFSPVDPSKAAEAEPQPPSPPADASPEDDPAETDPVAAQESVPPRIDGLESHGSQDAAEPTEGAVPEKSTTIYYLGAESDGQDGEAEEPEKVYDLDAEPAEVAGEDAEPGEVYDLDAEPAEVAGEDAESGEVYDLDAGTAEVAGEDGEPGEIYDLDAGTAEVAGGDAGTEKIYDLDAEPDEARASEAEAAIAGAASREAGSESWHADLETLLGEGNRTGAIALLLARGQAHERAGNPRKAVRIYEQLWELGHREERIAARLVELHEGLGEPHSASNWHVEIGEFKLRDGAWEEARQHFEAAQRLNPGHDLANRRLARLAHLETSAAQVETPPDAPVRDEEACGPIPDELAEVIDRALGASGIPVPPRPSVEPAAKGDVESPASAEGADHVAHILDRFVQDVGSQLGSEDHASHYDLSMAFMEMGLYREAAAELETAAQSDEYRQRCLELLATCYSRLDEPERSAECLRAAVAELGPNDPREADLRVRLSAVLTDAGMTEEARAVLREFVDNHPTHTGARQRLEALGG